MTCTLLQVRQLFLRHVHIYPADVGDTVQVIEFDVNKQGNGLVYKVAVTTSSRSSRTFSSRDNAPSKINWSKVFSVSRQKQVLTIGLLAKVLLVLLWLSCFSHTITHDLPRAHWWLFELTDSSIEKLWIISCGYWGNLVFEWKVIFQNPGDYSSIVRHYLSRRNVK